MRAPASRRLGIAGSLSATSSPIAKAAVIFAAAEDRRKCNRERRSVPSVVLLPSGTITIDAPWVMPASARLIGEGPGNTTLLANFTSRDMLDMGPSKPACTNYCKGTPSGTFTCAAVEIEHLRLNGNSQSGVNGTVNYYGQELSYVEDVAFLNIDGVALTLWGNIGNGTSYSANDSDPYSNLTMTSVGTCLEINGIGVTRGIHGLNCSATGPTAIYLDGLNNSLEDITLVAPNGSTNGILIGGILSSNNPVASNNILFNISGSGFQNLITISNTQPTGAGNCPGQTKGNPSPYNVCDITIMGCHEWVGRWHQYHH